MYAHVGPYHWKKSFKNKKRVKGHSETLDVGLVPKALPLVPNDFDIEFSD